MTDPPLVVKVILAVLFLAVLLWAGTKEASTPHYPNKEKITYGK